MTMPLFPTLNALLNFCAMVLLIFGFVSIKKRETAKHKKIMLASLVVSLVFLTSYLIYHYQHGSTPYPHYNWTRILYFSVLIPHIILAAVQTPFILYMVWQAWRGNFTRHKRIARWIWPIWMFVSISGVVVYLMLYQL